MCCPVDPSLQVFKDGSYVFIEINSFAGRTFLDLGRLLTGAKVSDTSLPLKLAAIDSGSPSSRTSFSGSIISL